MREDPALVGNTLWAPGLLKGGKRKVSQRGHPCCIRRLVLGNTRYVASLTKKSQVNQRKSVGNLFFLALTSRSHNHLWESQKCSKS